ncbi:hypothetical protein V2J09_020626 [Rumex salicifolius]
MADDGMRFLVQLRKMAIRTIRASSRSARNHPFLMGALLFVILLYRSSPFLFSLLVSASPVLVCTAVLLGTLLSFGNPQIPEIDKDEKISCEISSLRTAVLPNSTTVYHKEADKDVGDSASMGDVCSVSRFEESLLTPQNSREIVFEQRSVEEEKDEFKSREIEFTKENNEETLVFEGDHGIHGLIIDDHFEAENFEETALTFEGEVATDYEVQERGFENEGSDDGNVDDRVESSSVPWTRVNGDRGDGEDDDEDDEDDDDDDSGSDGAESSSPDPSMADIIPLLDELHPLIECESLIPHDQSHEDSGLLRNGSHGSIKSDEETDHYSGEEEEAGDDDVEEENRGEKEDAEKSAITWTEDDQKNLMDLGSSELERNQRLESLIARRRARRSIRMTTEKNLIDLDDLVLPFQVAPISTARQNPFDFPNDTFDNMDLPPIPGSAPSVMLQRRNPFDIPYDSGEEKPDLMDDSFQQEFTPPIQKEPVFRRHESFHVGSSFFEFPRQEPRDFHRASRFKPYFIPERLASEGGSSFNSYMRQSSEASDVSSFQRQTSGISEVSSFQRHLSDMSESKASSAAEIELVSAELDLEETKVDDPEIDHASEHVEHGSQSSENFDDQIEKSDFDLHMPEIILGESETYGTEFIQTEQGLGVEINLGSSANDRDVDSWVSEARDLAAIPGIIEGDMHLNASPVEDKHYSSSSSLSSEHDDVKEADNSLVKGEEIGFHLMENSDVQSENVFNTSAFHHHHSRHTHSAERNVFETNLTLETIQEEHIISPSSSLTSEERNITEGLKPNEAMMDVQHIMPGDSNPDSPTELALDSSNFGSNMDLEESHIKDPVYDLSPQASKINLSISSEDLADLENKELKLERDCLLHESTGEDDARVEQEDQIMSVIEERDAKAEAEHSSAQTDSHSTANFSTEEPDMVNEDANVVDVSDTVEERLISVAEEGGSVEDHCLISSPPFHYEEEPFSVPEKLEEVSSENRLHSEVDPEMNDLVSLPLQTIGTSSAVQDLSQEPVNDFIDFSEPVKGRGEFEFESSIVGDADEKSPFTDPFVPQSDMITELDEAFLSELDAVGDFHVTELGTAFTQETLEAENTEAGINELLDSHISEDKVQFQSLEHESVENIENSTDDNTPKSSSDVFFINESQPEVQNADLTGEFEYSPVLESEPIEKVQQPSDEDAEKSTYEPKAADTDTGLAELVESHVLESTTASHRPEPEFSQTDENAEIFAAIESISVQDELVVEGNEVGGLESAIKTDESITNHGDTSELQKEIVAETNESFPAMEEDIERLDVAAIDVPYSVVLDSDNVIEKDEPTAEIIESVHAMEEEIERSSVAAIDVSLNSRVLESETLMEKDEQVEELNEFVHIMEEEIERSSVAAIDLTLDSQVLESDTLVEKGESAEEIHEFVHVMEEEIERSAIDASFDTDVLKIDDLIEEEELTTAETNETIPAMEEESEWSAINASSDSPVLTKEALIEKDEQPAEGTDDKIPALIEEIERSAIDAFPDSSVSAQVEKDEQQDAESNELLTAMEEEVERYSIDASSDSDISKNNAQIDKDERPAALTNESKPAMEEEIISIDASLDSHAPKTDALIENAETNDSIPAMEEKIEGSVSANSGIDVPSDSHFPKYDAQIERDEQLAAETNESVPAMEEELERSSIDALTETQVSENNALVENAKTNESALTMEQERDFTNAFSDSNVLKNDAQIEKDEHLAAESNVSFPDMEEEIERSSVDSPTIENAEANKSIPCMEEAIEGSGASDSQIQKDESVPVMEDAIDIISDAQVSENNAVNPVIENEETNESALSMEEEREFADAVIQKNVPTLGDECQDAEEMGNHQAKSFPIVTVKEFESEQLTSAQDLTSVQIELAQSQALQDEDHQMGQKQLSVEHLKKSTESVSVTEESVGQGSSDTAPELPKREGE